MRVNRNSNRDHNRCIFGLEFKDSYLELRFKGKCNSKLHYKLHKNTHSNSTAVL